MYEWIHKLTLYTHIFIGGLALIVFWLPILEKKGSPKHKQYGRWFVWGMTAVSISGILMSTMVFVDPLAIRDPQGTLSMEQAIQAVERNRNFSAFLFMLSFLVLSSAQQSMLVLKAKANKAILKTPSHMFRLIMLLLSSIYVGLIGLQSSIMLFMIFSGLGLVLALAMLRYNFKQETKNGEWIIEHLSTVIGAGIGAYTAFFVFGGSRLLQDVMSSEIRLALWVLPGVIGTIIIRTFAAKYRQKYKIA